MARSSNNSVRQTQVMLKGIHIPFLWLSLGAIGLGSCASSAQRREPATVSPVAADAIEATLFLIGDAGRPARGGEPVLVALARDLARGPELSLVAFLGDNLYPAGLPDSIALDYQESERRIDALLNVVLQNGTRAVFVPGNHDWGSVDGWEAVLRQERYVRSRTDSLVQFLPGGGCPGPAVVDVGELFRVIALDTEWWLHAGGKPTHPDSDCPTDSEGEVLDSLGAVLERSSDRRIAVIAHHPIASKGPHGGYFTLEQHIFPLRDLKRWLWVPLPIIGSLYPISRKMGITNQDLSGPKYRRLSAALDSVLAHYQPLVYAAGHEHNLQVLEGVGGRYHLISGSGYYRRPSPVSWGDNTLYARRGSGYMRLDVLRNGMVRLGVIVVDESGVGREEFSMWLSEETAPDGLPE